MFSKEVLYIMINSVVFSKLFYCSAVRAGTYKENIHKLQLMQNFAARIVTDTGKYDHITLALKALGWLTIEEQLWLRDVTALHVNLTFALSLSVLCMNCTCSVSKRANRARSKRYCKSRIK